MGEKIDGPPCQRKRQKEACPRWEKPHQAQGLVGPEAPGPSLAVGPQRGSCGRGFPQSACGRWVHASGISAGLPGLLLGGEPQEEELHKGKLVGGPRLPGRAGGPWETSRPVICLLGSWWPPRPPRAALPPQDTSLQQPYVCSEPHWAAQPATAAPAPRRVFPSSLLTCPPSQRPLRSSLGMAGPCFVPCSLISGTQ